MPKDVIGVEMMWSLHTFNANTFEAISLYTQIWNGDESVMERLLDHDPLHGNKNKVAATTQPAGYWLYCGERSTEPESYLYEDWLINDINEWSHCNGHKLLGLRDILGEFSETATAQHIYKKRADGSYYNDMMCEFNELDAFDIDDEMAEEILSWPEYYLNLKSSQQLYLPQHAAVKFLKLGVVKLGKGKERIYQSMSRRAQYYAARHLTGGLSWSDIDKIKQRNDLVLLTKTQFDAHKLRLVMLYQQLACIVVSCHSASFINAINQEENINKMEVFQSVFTDAIGRYYINQNNSEKSKVLLNRIFDSTMSNAQELASGIVISNKEFLLDDIVTTFFCNLKSGSLLISEELILAGGFDKFKAIATELFMKLEFNEYPIISDTCSSHIIMRIDTSKEKHLTQTSLF
ncbi:hypothetical protein UA42_14610 [Photobacterium kishitanii]|nr:hypothetical protein [Photobacterium kishitanii]KJG60581.1 hypothetical protein UA42_14610 [Photobacterium kishitanii]